MCDRPRWLSTSGEHLRNCRSSGLVHRMSRVNDPYGYPRPSRYLIRASIAARKCFQSRRREGSRRSGHARPSLLQSRFRQADPEPGTIPPRPPSRRSSGATVSREALATRSLSRVRTSTHLSAHPIQTHPFQRGSATESQLRRRPRTRSTRRRRTRRVVSRRQGGCRALLPANALGTAPPPGTRKHLTATCSM